MVSGSKHCVIAMAAKSAVEEQFVERFTSGSAKDLKLPEGAILVAYQQVPQNVEAFHVVTFMKVPPDTPIWKTAALCPATAFHSHSAVSVSCLFPQDL